MLRFGHAPEHAADAQAQLIGLARLAPVQFAQVGVAALLVAFVQTAERRERDTLLAAGPLGIKLRLDGDCQGRAALLPGIDAVVEESQRLRGGAAASL